MGKFNIKKLPKGFRFIFTLKEIKEVEIFSGIEFKKVTNGNLINSKKFNNEAFIKSSFQAFSIHGKKTESDWEFSFYQSGFREELLPKIHEEEIKIILLEKIKKYLNQVYYSKETDCYKYPQLWSLIFIKENKAEVSWREIK